MPPECIMSSPFESFLIILSSSIVPISLYTFAVKYNCPACSTTEPIEIKFSLSPLIIFEDLPVSIFTLYM